MYPRQKRRAYQRKAYHERRTPKRPLRTFALTDGARMRAGVAARFGKRFLLTPGDCRNYVDRSSRPWGCGRPMGARLSGGGSENRPGAKWEKRRDADARPARGLRLVAAFASGASISASLFQLPRATRRRAPVGHLLGAAVQIIHFHHHRGADVSANNELGGAGIVCASPGPLHKKTVRASAEF